MSLLHFNFSKHTSPPNRYRIACPDGWVVAADDWELCLRLARTHCVDNDIPIPDDFDSQMEDRLCRTLPPGLCTYEDGSHPMQFVDVRVSIEDFGRGMEVLTSVATSPDPLVDQQTAEARARICAACPANIMIRGCYSCVQAAELVSKIRGAKTTTADNKLFSCAICKCANRAQVWVKKELLAKGVADEMKPKFESLPWCWKREVYAQT